ncbi:hypothetical protein Fleli_3321 [Bernardetia litoralis DSM 6794]|uniref:Uncharacterized protein n=1 Tax=Bernardetia litoralis (strain ATCC 23117 / DSM 6794 / NBRC 15988 / NCIMB 1366 / Fx l1 / Sio-4) TaxID=880071 RepID=I4ANW5_BERLS|nr:hypothetical protein [Bernardetia litoralis]AFM05650.1 hypothetical protein Fleli_3321 [Bernardetia litoralis DSM 6794]
MKKSKFSIFAYTLFILVGLFFLTGCFSEPNYPDTPQIEFVSLQNIESKARADTDSIVITLFFKDGDGDLGLTSTDTLAPFSERNSDGTVNRFRNNFFAEVERLNEDGEFEPVTFASENFNLDSRFPVLNTLDKETALEGDLRYSLILFATSFSPVQKDDILRYKISIADRNLNESNIIYTDAMRVGVYE